MLELKIKGGVVSIEAAGVNDMLLTEAAYAVASLIGLIASAAPDTLDRSKLRKVMRNLFDEKLTEALDDRLDHKGGAQ